MTNDKTVQTEIEGFISSFFESQFGESPSSVNAAIRNPFIAIHLIGFSLPSEKLLLKRMEAKRVGQTRDLLLNSVKMELFQELAAITGYDVKEIYADWNFEKESGLLIVVLDAETDPVSFIYPEGVNKEALHEIVIKISKITQKAPETIESYWLNDITVVVERRGIMVDIEKELIKNGVIEELRVAKRPLEHRVMEFFKLEPVLKQEINDLFVDWNFVADKAYMVFILEAKPN
ncbi:Na-translocating system protein MpsC family protein [Planococcus shenhongbingii]|uniref:Na-translocating system protein MpsC family protein n=1 Tax=Planococcus shenhongbingii TaxID=3058398 RepID=UPI002626B42A|nr:Na-translocating system protein MpsC family protein [Planococcus sp. N016]WKA59292.1 Na-translocating system protein MpsC family protein [Planococcus sp. N016]